MSSSLAICVLMIIHLCCCSALFLKVGKLAAEEMGPVKSTAASLVRSHVPARVPVPVRSHSLTATLAAPAILTGYVAEVFYSDVLCKSPLYAVFQALNSCFQTDTDTFQYITATSSSVATQEYSDSQCTVTSGLKLESYADNLCASSKKTFINETTSFNTNITTASQR